MQTDEQIIDQYERTEQRKLEAEARERDLNRSHQLRLEQERSSRAFSRHRLIRNIFGTTLFVASIGALGFWLHTSCVITGQEREEAVSSALQACLKEVDVDVCTVLAQNESVETLREQEKSDKDAIDSKYKNCLWKLDAHRCEILYQSDGHQSNLTIHAALNDCENKDVESSCLRLLNYNPNQVKISDQVSEAFSACLEKASDPNICRVLSRTKVD